MTLRFKKCHVRFTNACSFYMQAVLSLKNSFLSFMFAPRYPSGVKWEFGNWPRYSIFLFKLSLQGMIIKRYRKGIKLICSSANDGDQWLSPKFTIQQFWLHHEFLRLSLANIFLNSFEVFIIHSLLQLWWLKNQINY